MVTLKVTITFLLMDILIVGTGALATLFAARLTEAGHDMTLLGTWKEGLNALRKNGARLVDTNGDEKQFKVQATDDLRDCLDARYVIVLVKSWQTERAAKQLVEYLAEDAIVLTLQNGLGNYEMLARHLGDNRVILGTITIGATLLEAGLVKEGGEGSISIEQNQALGPLGAALRSAKFNVEIIEDAQSLVWGKLVVNAAINPLTALLRITNGELLERRSAREMMGKLAQEAAQIARAENIRLPFIDPVNAAEEVARKTATNRSSMLQDVLRRAPTEIDAICGAVVRTAQRHGIETPVNWACWKLVKALEING